MDLEIRTNYTLSGEKNTINKQKNNEIINAASVEEHLKNSVQKNIKKHTKLTTKKSHIKLCNGRVHSGPMSWRRIEMHSLHMPYTNCPY